MNIMFAAVRKKVYGESRGTKVNCSSSLVKGTRQLNGLENVSYVSLPFDSISVRPFREALANVNAIGFNFVLLFIYVNS